MDHNINQLITDVELLKQNARTFERDITRIEQDTNKKVGEIKSQISKLDDTIDKKLQSLEDQVSKQSESQKRSSNISQFLLGLILVSLIISVNIIGFSDTSQALKTTSTAINKIK